MTNSSKIFGIGLSKTGTTSLANALEVLGYHTKDNMGVVTYAAGDLSSIDLATIDAHDALTDTPIPSFYRELDARCPGSKFILTVRDRTGWLQSCRKQFTPRFAQIQNDAHRRLFVDLYGTDVFDADRFAEGYERFVSRVKEYFRDRERELLIIDVAAGEGWEKLCPFLNRSLPDEPFPKANVTRVRWMDVKDVAAIARQAGAELMRFYDGERHLESVRNDGMKGGQSVLRAAKLVNRALRAVRGRNGVRGAKQAAHEIAIKGLRKLDPTIPVLSSAEPVVSYPERRRWNHFWLVDPLDGERAFADGTARFSVNVALIEDGKPIYGVVFAPALGTLYFASSRKSAFKVENDGEPQPFAPRNAGDRERLAGTGQQETSKQNPANGATSSCALALCSIAEGDASAKAIPLHTMEWETAAAQVVLNAAGMCIVSKDSKELRYNKPELANDQIMVK